MKKRVKLSRTVLKASNMSEPLPLEQDPALLYKWKCDLDKYIVGEDKNKLIVVLVCATCKNTRPIALVILGESSAGKSYLVKNVLFPYFDRDDRIIHVSRVTGPALNRLQENLNGKILFVDELSGTDKATEQLRVMISEGNLTLLASVFDDKGRVLEKSKKIVTEGTPVFITTTTNATLENELNTRMFVTSIDESEEQTRNILNMKGKRAATPQLATEITPDPRFHLLIESLQPVKQVLIPYGERLSQVFPASTIKARRDFDKLTEMIEICAFIHQHKRPMLKLAGEYYLIALPVDFFLAWRIIDEATSETLTSLNKRLRKIMNIFNAEQRYTVQTVAQLTGYTASRANELLRELSDHSFLLREDQVRPYVYYRNPDKTRILVTIEQIITELNSFGESEAKMYSDSILRFTIDRALSGLQKENIYKLLRIDVNDSLTEKLTDVARNSLESILSFKIGVIHWRYESQYVDPLNGSSYTIGDPEILEYWKKISGGKPTETKMESITPTEAEIGTDSPIVSVPHIGEGKTPPDKALFDLLSDGGLHTKEELMEKMAAQGVNAPDLIIRKFLQRSYIYEPAQGVFKLTQDSLYRVLEPGHAT